MSSRRNEIFTRKFWRWSAIETVHFPLPPPATSAEFLYIEAYCGTLPQAMHFVVTTLLCVLALLGAALLVWRYLRRRWLASVPFEYQSSPWVGVWMSRNRSVQGRVYVYAPSPTLPEGSFQIEALIYYEFFRGLFWAWKPISISLAALHEDGEIINDPFGAASPVLVGEGREEREPDLRDEGWIRFQGKFDASGEQLFGDFYSQLADESGTFRLSRRR